MSLLLRSVVVLSAGRGAFGRVQCDYLGSDVQAASAEVGWARYTIDSVPAGGDASNNNVHDGIDLDGLHYDKGIFAHAPSRVVFNLNGAYQSFSGCAGISTMADCGVAGAGGPRHENGDVDFSIVADGATVWSWYGDAGDHGCFELSARGVQQLEFVGATAGSHSCDAATWTDLKACTSTQKGEASVHGCDAASVATAITHVHAVCCAAGTDCTSEVPSSCSQGCADVFTPFFEACESQLTESIHSAVAPLFSICVDRADVPVDALETCSYLGSDIEPFSARVGWGMFEVDGTCAVVQGSNSNGNPPQFYKVPRISIGGVEYEKGIFTHASSEVIFNLDSGYSTVSGCAGLARLQNANCGTGHSNDHGDVQFTITAGTDTAQPRTIFSRAMQGGTADGLSNCFSLAITGITQLTFTVDSQGTQNCDSSAWGDLKVCRESTDSCSFDSVLPAAIACSDYDSVEALSARSFCTSPCASLSRDLAGSCASGAPAGLESILPVLQFMDAAELPTSCGTTTVAAGAGAAARQCQATLGEFQTLFQEACCADGACQTSNFGADGSSQGFIPQTCTERCEEAFIPFFSECGAAVWGGQPERFSAMRDLARICTHGGVDTTGQCVYLGSDVEATSTQVGWGEYAVDGIYADAPRGSDGEGPPLYQPGGIIIGGHHFLKGSSSRFLPAA